MSPTDAIQILFQFLASLLPDGLMSAAIGLAPVVAAAVALALLHPWVKERKRWSAPVIALLIGEAFGLATVQTAGATLYQAILFGVVTALLAVGGVSWAKNVAQGTRSGGVYSNQS